MTNGNKGVRQGVATAMKRAMTTVTRVAGKEENKDGKGDGDYNEMAGNKEGDGEGGKSDGNGNVDGG